MRQVFFFPPVKFRADPGWQRVEVVLSWVLQMQRPDGDSSQTETGVRGWMPPPRKCEGSHLSHSGDLKKSESVGILCPRS